MKDNDVSAGYFRSSNLEKRIDKIVRRIASQSSFKPEKLLGKSSWWGSKTIGAFHYRGTYEGVPCVLKVQGVKPETSEVFMIESFERQNRSSIIRPPKIYYKMSWDESLGYEAFIMEDAEGKLKVGVPSNQEEVEEFFKLYREYRTNCRTKPWIKKPQETIPETIKSRFERWIKASFEIYPNHPFRHEEDQNLIAEAIGTLTREYERVKPEFVHGHFSHRDLYQVDREIVVLSNLYWAWRPPFYDTIFARHWFRYDLAGKEESTPEQIENQLRIWDEQIKKIPTNEEERRLLNLALLERSAAGLNLDALSVKTDRPCAEFIVEQTRIELQNLLTKFRKS